MRRSRQDSNLDGFLVHRLNPFTPKVAKTQRRVLEAIKNIFLPTKYKIYFQLLI